MVKPAADRVPPDVRRLFAEMQAGDQAAGWRLIMRLAELALPVVRRHLNPSVRRFVDSTDIMQNIVLAAARHLHDTLAPGWLRLGRDSPALKATGRCTVYLPAEQVHFSSE